MECISCQAKCEKCGEEWYTGGSGIWVPVIGIGMPALVIILLGLVVKFC